MKLVLTSRAQGDLNRLRDFIDKKNKPAAKKSSQQLIENIKSLLAQPLMGAELAGLPGFRELVARSYIVRYRIVEEEVVILKVWHVKEDR